MKKEETAYSVFRKLTRSLARDLAQFIILSPAHDLSAHHKQVTVHIVRVKGFVRKRLAVYATTSDTQYQSAQVKLLELRVTRTNVLQIKTPHELIQEIVACSTYNDLRDLVCTRVADTLLEQVEL